MLVSNLLNITKMGREGGGMWGGGGGGGLRALNYFSVGILSEVILE